MKNTVIVAAKRSAIGSFGGSLSQVKAHDIAATVLQDILKTTDIDPKEISEVIMGQVLVGGEGQNTARQSAMKADIPYTTPAFQVNQVCASGLRSVALAHQHIALGDAEIVVAGGQENMSRSPHIMHLRNPLKMGPAQMTDSMIQDGLWDAYYDYHMGNTAENLAERWSISREEQDEFAVQSQQKAAAAQAAGKFKKEITPISVKIKKDEIIFEHDEYIRANANIESLAKLRPAFTKDGSVTAGNASGINDGAAALLLMSEEKAVALGLEPLAVIRSWATAGVDPQIMGSGPIPASQMALKKAGWTVDDLDVIEANEAFAAQAITVNKEMGWDTSKVNVNGGAIALGHPIGASGARILVTLLHEMQASNKNKGLATLCVGGGMGLSICVERN